MADVGRRRMKAQVYHIPSRYTKEVPPAVQQVQYCVTLNFHSVQNLMGWEYEVMQIKESVFEQNANIGLLVQPYYMRGVGGGGWGCYKL